MLRSYIENNTIIPPEIEDGNIEYKQRLDQKDKNKIKKMASQMLWRLNEGKFNTGKSQAHYFIGINDNGDIAKMYEDVINISIEIINEVAQRCKAEISNIDKIYINEYCVAEIIVCRRANGNFIKESRVCFLGQSGHGKTTLISHLTYNQLDNGNGLARSLVLKHTHEQNSGLTSSIKHDIIGLNSKKEIVNYKYGIYCNWENIVLNSEKIIALTDLPGMDRFYKTTLYGLFSLKPHFNIIIISPHDCQNNNEFIIADEIINNIKINISLNIPFIIIFTKYDLYQTDENFIEKIDQVIKSFTLERNLYEFNNEIKDNLLNIPYIYISSINGYNYHLLLKLIDFYSEKYNNKNKNTEKFIKERTDTEFVIHDSYIIPNRGNIVYGILNSGQININENYLLGPINEKFYPISIGTIHKKQIDSKNIYPDESASIEIKLKTELEITKNMYIVKSEKQLDLHNIMTIILLENNNSFLKVGSLYTIIFDNIVESIIIDSINENKTNVQFLKKQYRPIKYNTICILKETFNNNLVIGKIIN